MAGTPMVLRTLGVPSFAMRGTNLARNRYGWQKRAKEMARKEKNDEKMKRRQGKIVSSPAEVMPEVSEEFNLNEPNRLD
jgi:hypothetical protein